MWIEHKSSRTVAHMGDHNIKALHLSLHSTPQMKQVLSVLTLILLCSKPSGYKSLCISHLVNLQGATLPCFLPLFCTAILRTVQPLWWCQTCQAFTQQAVKCSNHFPPLIWGWEILNEDSLLSFLCWENQRVFPFCWNFAAIAGHIRLRGIYIHTFTPGPHSLHPVPDCIWELDVCRWTN